MLFLLTLIMPIFSFAANQTATIKNITFDPKVIEVKFGDSVQWINKSMKDHSGTSYPEEAAATKFDTGLVKPKEDSKKIVFQTPGTYMYHCLVHGNTMTGKVVVTP